MILLSRVLALLTLGIAMLAASTARADNVKEATRYYEQANEAFRNREFAGAAELYGRSLELVKHADTLFNMAESQARAGQHVQAARSYRKLLEGFAPPMPEGDHRENIQRALSEQEKRVGRLKIVVDAPGASITVDGDAIGKSPLGSEWHVTPGEHEVSATKPGLISKSQRVTVAAGEVADVRLVLRAESGMPGAGLGTGPEAPGPGGEDPTKNGARDGGLPTKTVVVIGGLALTAAALAVGIGFGLDHNAAESDADDLLDRVGGKHGCTNVSSAQCDDLREKRDRAKSSGQIATIGFVGFGALGAATLAAVLLWPEEKSEPASRRGVRVTPMFGHAPGMSLQGTF